MVADELPRDMVARFLEVIQECEGTVYQGEGGPKSAAEHALEEARQEEKRRDHEEITQGEKSPEKKQEVLKKKSMPAVKEPPKGVK